VIVEQVVRAPDVSQPAVTRSPAPTSSPAPVPAQQQIAAAQPDPAPQRLAAPATEPGAADATADGDTYVVRSGDTLWDVAAARLGSDATEKEIAAEVRRLFRLNADVLESPDVIVPGDELKLR
jgi:nucleoid-associated protein YgaU